ncbi:MAG: hypothetical protein OSJ74_10155, partial [Clostridia bacterium]|nr:hypothetical protein [Clostridia bacterium]
MTAEAIINTSDTAKVLNLGSILRNDYETISDGRIFDGEVLASLYESITGKSDATLKDVEDLIDSAPQKLGSPIVTSAAMRANSGGKDIVVKFGGYAGSTGNYVNYEWNVTSLTTDRTGKNLIATLWLANTNNNIVKSSKFSVFGGNNTSNTPYLANLYGTSYVRVKTLNAGGYYATSTSAVSALQQKDPTNEWAKFTMEDVAGSLTDYILTPADVAYQETESFPGIESGAYTTGNESYGKPNVVKWQLTGKNYYQRSYGADWKDDYLWIPSLVETGRANGGASITVGLWDTTANQRINTVSLGSWLRTDSYAGYSIMNALEYDSGRASSVSTAPTATFGVCPCLHLNLTAAETDAFNVPVSGNNVETVYNGNVQSMGTVADSAYSKLKDWHGNDFTFGSIKKNGVVITNNDVIDVGEYELDITLNNNLFWRDLGVNGSRTRTCKLIIKPKQLPVSFTIDSKTGTVQTLSYNPTDVYPRDGTLNLGVRYKGKTTGNSNPSSVVTGYDSTTAPT